jgi:hypothetical protein
MLRSWFQWNHAMTGIYLPTTSPLPTLPILDILAASGAWSPG